MNTEIDIIRARLAKPIVMVGLMGAGKTKIGGLVAQTLGLPFVDADAEIEKTAGCTVADIFEQFGEPEFRYLERKVITRLLAEELRVIAPGGGAIMNPDTAALIKSSAISIWLRAELDILVERTSRSSKRPLLKNGNPREILQGLMDKRYPVYAQSDITVETALAEASITAENVLKALAAHLQSAGE